MRALLREGIYTDGNVAMSRIYDAIVQAEKDLALEPERVQAELIVPLRAKPAPNYAKCNLRDQLYKVYQAVAAERTDEGKILTFCGARTGEGVSTITREFAKLASTELGDRVLLLDADHGEGRHAERFGVALLEDCEAVARGRKEISDVLFPAIQDKLTLGAVTLNGTFTASITQDETFVEMLAEFRKQFDLILIDAPPATGTSQALAFAPMTDGVVFVLAAESTRWQVAKMAKENIEKAGGKVLGVILNGKQHHIPKFIYNRL